MNELVTGDLIQQNHWFISY